MKKDNPIITAWNMAKGAKGMSSSLSCANSTEDLLKDYAKKSEKTITHVIVRADKTILEMAVNQNVRIASYAQTSTGIIPTGTVIMSIQEFEELKNKYEESL